MVVNGYIRLNHFDGSAERNKSYLVVRDDDQVEGLDFKEIFALIAKLVSVRVFLVVPAIKG